VVGLKGNLAPDGAIVKIAGMANCASKAPLCASTPKKKRSRRCVCAPTNRRRDRRALRRSKRWTRHAGDAVHDGGDLWQSEHQGKEVALITDGRFSGATRASALAMSVRKRRWRPIALLRNGDRIVIDAAKAPST